MTILSFGFNATMPANKPQLSNVTASREKVNAVTVPPETNTCIGQFSGLIKVNGLAVTVTAVLAPVHIPLTLEVATIFIPRK